ncbi:SigE family RNA polymerase sigma factor [Nostocoides veronense]|uniref:SigE family RNA polymerase sigma factor n=1 Tax=Nostocoides veronense TaxID=330836 RepID=A0ABP4XWN7_9MICO
MEVEELVRARYGALVRAAFLLTGSREGAEDLVQDVLVRAGTRWPRITDRGHPEAYVRRMLVTQSIDTWRKWHREVPAGEATAYLLQSAAEPVAVPTRVALARALARLTPKQRAVLVLRYVEDLTEVATAEALGVAVGTVKSQTRDALARLRVVAPELLAVEDGVKEES